LNAAFPNSTRNFSRTRDHSRPKSADIPISTFPIRVRVGGSLFPNVSDVPANRFSLGPEGRNTGLEKRAFPVKIAGKRGAGTHTGRFIGVSK
jgi:hypothetical protein